MNPELSLRCPSRRSRPMFWARLWIAVATRGVLLLNILLYESKTDDAIGQLRLADLLEPLLDVPVRFHDGKFQVGPDLSHLGLEPSLSFLCCCTKSGSFLLQCCGELLTLRFGFRTKSFPCCRLCLFEALCVLSCCDSKQGLGFSVCHVSSFLDRLTVA